MASTDRAEKNNPFPTAIDLHELNCALILAENARAMMAEAFRLLKGDVVLSQRTESAGFAIVALHGSVMARVQAKKSALA